MTEVKNPPAGMPRITPYLFYRDVRAALVWLHRTFGFEVKGEPLEMQEGMLHAEMGYQDGFMMMGTPSEERGAKSPHELSGIHQSLYIYVDDVDAHYRQALAEGATTLTEPMDMFWGDRMYAVKDLEGHHWSFAQHIKDVSVEDLAAQTQQAES
ncbi:MAG: VOC family protein [Gammaproteobacteria bacterium]|nr:VOC family protein [Gammaproteobacteria bacterium]